MKKRILALLGLTSIALVASVINFSPKKSDSVNPDGSGRVKVPDSEYNPIFYPAVYSTDIVDEPYYNEQKTKTFNDMGFKNAPSLYRGENVKVAVIDSGINYNHEDFPVINSDSRTVDNQSGEWLYYPYSSYQSRINDTHGHGTHVASVIASQINELGCAGIAPNVDLYVYKVTNSANGYEWTAINSALEYCIEEGMDVVNMSFQAYEHAVSYNGSSLGASSGCSGVLITVLTRCHNAGITLVGAAGNFNTSEPSYPASNDYVISVGSFAQNNKNTKAGFSNTFGIDLVAPGYVTTAEKGSTNAYTTTSGTSFSAPIVTAAIALYKQKNPSATPAQIEAALYASCDPVSGNPGWAGNGALNVDRFLGIEDTDIESVSLEENTKTIDVGDTYQLSPTVYPLSANQGIIYESYDPTVCTVDENGLVTAVGVGSCYVYATSVEDETKYDSVYITVESAAPKTGNIDLSHGVGTGSGDTYSITWAMDNVISIKQEKSTGNPVSSSYISTPHWYANNLITFAPLGGSTITKIEFTCDSSSYASPLGSGNWSNGSATTNNNVATWTGNATSAFTVTLSAQARISAISVTYAQGAIVNYDVSFNGNGGSGSMDSAETSGSTYTAPLCNFTYTDHVFDGWTVNGTTGTKYAVGDEITGITTNITLYANWVSGSSPTPGPTSDYYKDVTATSGTTLLAQLHTLMGKTHKKYTTYNDCKDTNKVYSTDPGTTSAYVTDFYSQTNISRSWGSGKTGTWNREHVWCQSLSAGLWGESYGGSDLQHVRPLESTLNSTRNNHPFGVVPTHNNTTAKYTKNTSGSFTSNQGGWYQNGLDIFEPIDASKGDVARILMYVYMHYSNATGGTDGTISGHTGNLQITDIVNTSPRTEQAAWNLLLQWNTLDPVSENERIRNEAAFELQGNRNPFIDNDKYAAAIWGNTPLTTKTLSSISLSGTHKKSFDVGDTFSYNGLVVTAHYSDNSEATVTPTSVSSPDMSTAGEKPITVSYTEGGVTKDATYTINVNAIPATSIALDTTSTSVKIGKTVTLTATVNPSNTTDKTVTWTSSDNNIATVSGGVVRGVAAGTATITATTSNNLTATCDVTVQAPTVDTVTLDLSEKKVRYTASTPSSNTFTLTATLTAEEGATVTWTSSNTHVIRVVISGGASAASSSTEVTGNFEIVGTGTSTITASAGGKSATCEVKATLPVKSYVAEPTSTSVAFTGSTSSVPSKLYEVYTDSTRECIDENYMLSVDSSNLGNATASSIYDGKTVTANVVVTNQGSSGETIKTQEDYNKQAEAWAIYFIAQTRTDATCLAKDDITKLRGLNAVWSSLGSEYGNMLANSKTAFCSSTASAKIKEALQHYQYIISKFNKDGEQLTDFVVDGGGKKPTSSSRSLFSTMFSVENTGLTIAILSVIGIAAIAGFVLYRKRKTY